jgi:hypothetical protein
MARAGDGAALRDAAYRAVDRNTQRTRNRRAGHVRDLSSGGKFDAGRRGPGNTAAIADDAGAALNGHSLTAGDDRSREVRDGAAAGEIDRIVDAGDAAGIGDCSGRAGDLDASSLGPLVADGGARSIRPLPPLKNPSPSSTVEKMLPKFITVPIPPVIRTPSSPPMMELVLVTVPPASIATP